MTRNDDSRRRPPPATSGKAIISLVLGILCFCLPCVAAIPALALGFFGLKDINESGGRITGKGLAIAGIITSVLGSLCSGTLIGGIFLGSAGHLAFLGVGDAAERVVSTNNLRQIGFAFAAHEDVNKTLPSSAMRHPGNPVPHSWRVAILPFIEREDLYRMYKFDEPWDGPNNKLLLDKMPKIYAMPGKSNKTNETYYQMFVGKATVGEGGMTLNKITNGHGSSNTLLVVEAAESVPWTKPQDLPYAPDQSLPKLGGHHRKVFLGVFCDGSVGSFSPDADEKSLRALITYDDPDNGARERLTR